MPEKRDKGHLKIKEDAVKKRISTNIKWVKTDKEKQSREGGKLVWLGYKRKWRGKRGR